MHRLFLVAIILLTSSMNSQAYRCLPHIICPGTKSDTTALSPYGTRDNETFPIGASSSRLDRSKGFQKKMAPDVAKQKLQAPKLPKETCSIKGSQEPLCGMQPKNESLPKEKNLERVQSKSRGITKLISTNGSGEAIPEKLKSVDKEWRLVAFFFAHPMCEILLVGVLIAVGYPLFAWYSRRNSLRVPMQIPTAAVVSQVPQNETNTLQEIRDMLRELPRQGRVPIGRLHTRQDIWRRVEAIAEEIKSDVSVDQEDKNELQQEFLQELTQFIASQWDLNKDINFLDRNMMMGFVRYERNSLKFGKNIKPNFNMKVNCVFDVAHSMLDEQIG